MHNILPPLTPQGLLTCLLPTIGNHEIEAQEDANLTIFASVQARWKVLVVGLSVSQTIRH